MTTTAALLPNAEQVFLDNNGAPLANGQVFFYIPFTTTTKTVWADPGMTTPLSQPVALDSAGRAIIYGSGEYSQAVYDAQNNLVWNQLTTSPGSGGSGSTSIAITRAQIATSSSLPSTFTVTGYRTAGDLGAGATYTSIGATSAGLQAIFSADGVWYNLTSPNSVFSAGWFGAYGDGSLHAISSSDISASSFWRGVYGVGTSWDSVAIQECLYACFAISSSPSTIVWNNQSGGAGSSSNRRFFCPVGNFQINMGLFFLANGFNFSCAAPSATSWVYVGSAILTGTTNSTTTISNVPAATLQLLSSTIFSQGAGNSKGVNSPYIQGLGIPYGTTIVSVNVGAGTLLLSKAATSSVGSFQGYTYSTMLFCNSVDYGTFNYLYMKAGVNLPYNNSLIDLTTVPYPELGPSLTALMVLDHQSSSPTLATQYVTFNDCHWEGQSLADCNLSISPRGGAAEGATIAWYNCSSNQSKRTAVQQGGANALGNVWHNGDMLLNHWVGYAAYSGTIKIDNTTFEGQVGASLTASPQDTQVGNGGSDALFGAGQGEVTLSGMYNVRSEGCVLAQAYGQFPDIVACGTLGADILGSFRNYPFQLASIIQPVTNNTKSRLFICVDTGGTNAWNTMTPNAVPSFTITDPAASYSVNQWVGYTLFFRFGSNGFTLHFTGQITSNTATTITNGQQQLTPAADSLYSIGGQSGGSEPNWDSVGTNHLTNPGVQQGGAFTLTAGNTTIIGPAGISNGQYVFVPNGDVVGLAPEVSGNSNAHNIIYPFIAKVVSSPGAGTYVVNKAPGRNVLLGAGFATTASTIITDGNLTWAEYDFAAVTNAQRVQDCQFQSAAVLNSVRILDGTALLRKDADQSILDPQGRNIYSRTWGQVVSTPTEPISPSTGTVDITAYWQSGQYTPLTPSGNMTLNSTTAPSSSTSQIWVLGITTSGTSPYTLTFGTNFSSNGTLSTGAVSGADFLIGFVSVNGIWVEQFRYPVSGLTTLTPLGSVPTSISINPTLSTSLGKSIDVTTGSSSDVTLTLLAAATAGVGALQWVQKVDSGANKVIVTDGANALAWLSTQYDSVLLRSNGASWTVYSCTIAPRIDNYSSNGSYTWTKPPLAVSHDIVVISAGSGGGSGARYASALASSGGAGGAAGAGNFTYDLTSSILGATESVVVGAGGAGGAAQTVDSSDGNNGVAGGVSSFSSGVKILTSTAGSGGGGGKLNANSVAGGGAGSGRIGAATGPAGPNGAAGTNASQNVNTWVVLGSGSGAGQAVTTPATFNGGLPGLSLIFGMTQGTAGIGSSKTNPVAGVGIRADFGIQFGTGGGGGWVNADGTAGAGGAGTSCGGGGGGGGASANGNASGAGGNGADGCVYVRTYFV